MKTKFKERLKQKIIIPLIIILSFNFIVPNYARADDSSASASGVDVSSSSYTAGASKWGGVLLAPIVTLLGVIGDTANSLIYSTVEAPSLTDGMKSMLGMGEYSPYISAEIVGLGKTIVTMEINNLTTSIWGPVGLVRRCV